jgi:hypothetical protein
MSWRSTVERLEAESRSVDRGGPLPRIFHEGQDQGHGKHAGEGLRVTERATPPLPARVSTLPTLDALSLNPPPPPPAGPRIRDVSEIVAAFKIRF